METPTLCQKNISRCCPNWLSLRLTNRTSLKRTNPAQSVCLTMKLVILIWCCHVSTVSTLSVYQSGWRGRTCVPTVSIECHSISKSWEMRRVRMEMRIEGRLGMISYKTRFTTPMSLITSALPSSFLVSISGVSSTTTSTSTLSNNSHHSFHKYTSTSRTFTNLTYNNNKINFNNNKCNSNNNSNSSNKSKMR